MKCVGNALPGSPRRQVCIVKRLAKKFGLIAIQGQPKRPNPVMAQTEEVVCDEISRQQPGKRDCITIKRDGKQIKRQKKTLIMTVMEAFKQLKKEYPNLKMEKSKFAALHPANVVSVSEKDQNVCCCQYHENFELLLNGIRKHLPNVPPAETLIELTVCGWHMDCYTGECDNCKEFSMVVDDLFGSDAARAANKLFLFP